MTRTFKCALSCVFVGLVVPALCQDSFPDSPSNHWAFEALTRLKKDGILVGYPDGLYRGGRPASRYELAAAVHAAYVSLKGRQDAVAAAIQTLNDKLASNAGVTKADLDGVRAAIVAAQSQVDAMKGYGSDIADLKKLAATFEKELQSMGVDIDALKKGLDGLDSRVSALEKRKLPVGILGELNVLGLGGYSAGNVFGVTVDGRPTGVGRGDTGITTPGLISRGTVGGGTPPLPLDTAAHVGLTRDLTALNETAITLIDNLHGSDPNWRIVAVMGNMLDTSASGALGFGNQNAPQPGQQFREAHQSIYIQNASAKFEGKFHSLPFRFEMGRVDHRVSPYTFQRPDNTPYFADERWDNGKWAIDGVFARLGSIGKGLNIFAGRTADSTSVGGSVIQSLRAGSAITPFVPGLSRPLGQSGGAQMPVDQVIGADIHLPFLKNGEILGTYIELQSNSSANFNFPVIQGNRVQVYGGSFKALLGGIIPLHASYAKSNVFFNNDSVVNNHNEAVELGISGHKGILGLNAGYRTIGLNFGAPGDWGRIGMWWNPVGISDAFVQPQIDIAPNWQLSVTTHFSSGLGQQANVNLIGNRLGPLIPLGKGDHSQNLSFGLTHKMSGGKQMLIGIEDTNWNLQSRPSGLPSFPGGKPRERWYDFGLGMSKQNTTFSILWQVSDYNSNGVPGFQPFTQSTQTSAHGGLVTTQMTTRF